MYPAKRENHEEFRKRNMNAIEQEKRIADLLGKMTLEEKVSLCHANSKFTIASIERLGVEELVMSDGPHGVRPEMERHSWKKLNRPEDACTYLPTGTALAATWNPQLGSAYGAVLGSEARYRGKDIILGPGVNIIRTPLCGRNFEYMSEDPCLISKMAPGLVKGIQSRDVAACVKHYCLNNQELDRFGVNVEDILRIGAELTIQTSVFITVWILRWERICLIMNIILQMPFWKRQKKAKKSGTCWMIRCAGSCG